MVPVLEGVGVCEREEGRERERERERESRESAEGTYVVGCRCVCV